MMWSILMLIYGSVLLLMTAGSGWMTLRRSSVLPTLNRTVLTVDLVSTLLLCSGIFVYAIPALFGNINAYLALLPLLGIVTDIVATTNPKILAVYRDSEARLARAFNLPDSVRDSGPNLLVTLPLMFPAYLIAALLAYDKWYVFLQSSI